MQERMDELGLPHLLDEGAPEAGPQALARIIRRHGLRRLRRARIAASAAVVVALAGVGVGIGLSSSPHGTVADEPALPSSRHPGEPPPGLAWEKGSAGPGAETAAPGVFGWLGGTHGTATPLSEAAASGSRRASPPAAVYGRTAGRALPAVCTTQGCGLVYGARSSRRLFERTVDGVTIEAELSQYALPEGKMLPEAPVSGGSGSASAASGSSARTARPSNNHYMRVALPCFSPSELIVTVSGGGTTDTLAVPGSASTQPFSVLASASAELGGDNVIVAVTHTSPLVRTVTSQFPGGGDDRMSPVDGWSVLAHRTHGGGDPWCRSGDHRGYIGHRNYPRAGQPAIDGLARDGDSRDLSLLARNTPLKHDSSPRFDVGAGRRGAGRRQRLTCSSEPRVSAPAGATSERPSARVSSLSRILLPGWRTTSSRSTSSTTRASCVPSSWAA